jgi:hypothetical protein
MILLRLAWIWCKIPLSMMKIKVLACALLISSCLTSWAFPPTVTQEKLDKIRIGQTTEADLVQLFGNPTTRQVDLANYVSVDWFRSVPIPWQGYVPFVEGLLGGLDVDGQQLSVVLSPGGRVVRYSFHSTLEKLHATHGAKTVQRQPSYAK